MREAHREMSEREMVESSVPRCVRYLVVLACIDNTHTLTYAKLVGLLGGAHRREGGGQGPVSEIGH